MMLAAILALAVQGASPAERWVEFSRDDLLIQSVDAGSLRVEGDRRIFRHRVVFTRPMPDDTVSMVFGTEVNCRRGTLALLSGTTLNGAGGIIQSYELPRPSPQPRDSIDPAMIALVCRPNPG